MIIGTEITEGKAGAEVGSGTNRTDTEIMIIVALAELAVLALIMTGSIPDTGLPTELVLFFCSVLPYLNALNFTPLFNYWQSLSCT
jgi:hypothetical protein